MENRKLYAGGLNYAIDDQRLREIFAPHGTVESAQVIMDRMTGRSRGFGFVEMSSEAEAQNAIDGLNGVRVDGRTLTVNIAKPRQPRFDRDDRDSGYGGRRW